MKIDKRDFPIHSGDFNIDYLDEIQLKNGINNTMYFSNKILDIVDRRDLNFLKLRNEIKNISRSVIYKHKGLSYCFIYSFEVKDKLTEYRCIIQLVQRRLRIATNFFYGNFHHEDVVTKFHIGNNNKDNFDPAIVIQMIVQYEIFLQYAKIETKVLKKNQKDSILCRYENKLPFPITIVDSTWYTNLIKSDAFKVRGHFRLQPFGESRKERKLIWINEFQKEGYTREAKMLQDL